MSWIAKNEDLKAKKKKKKKRNPKKLHKQKTANILLSSVFGSSED